MDISGLERNSQHTSSEEKSFSTAGNYTFQVFFSVAFILATCGSSSTPKNTTNPLFYFIYISLLKFFLFCLFSVHAFGQGSMNLHEIRFCASQNKRSFVRLPFFARRSCAAGNCWDSEIVASPVLIKSANANHHTGRWSNSTETSTQLIGWNV